MHDKQTNQNYACGYSQWKKNSWQAATDQWSVNVTSPKRAALFLLYLGSMAAKCCRLQNVQVNKTGQFSLIALRFFNEQVHLSV